MKLPQEQVERIAALGYTNQGSLPLYSGDAFRLLHPASLQRLCRRPSWQAFHGVRAEAAENTLTPRCAITWARGRSSHLFSRLIYGPIDKRQRPQPPPALVRLHPHATRADDFLLENLGTTSLRPKVRRSISSVNPRRSEDLFQRKFYEGGIGSKSYRPYSSISSPSFSQPHLRRLACGHVRFCGFRHGKPLEFCCASRGLSRALSPLEVFSPALYSAASDRIRRAEDRFVPASSGRSNPTCPAKFSATSRFAGSGRKHEYVVPVTADFEFLNEARRRFHGSDSRVFTKHGSPAGLPNGNYGSNSHN